MFKSVSNLPLLDHILYLYLNFRFLSYKKFAIIPPLDQGGFAHPTFAYLLDFAVLFRIAGDRFTYVNRLLASLELEKMFMNLIGRGSFLRILFQHPSDWLTHFFAIDQGKGRQLLRLHCFQARHVAKRRFPATDKVEDGAEGPNISSFVDARVFFHPFWRIERAFIISEGELGSATAEIVDVDFVAVQNDEVILTYIPMKLFSSMSLRKQLRCLYCPL